MPYIIATETAPQPLAEILSLRPAFAAPAHWRDPAKIQEHLRDQERKWLDAAALNPLTGRVLVLALKPFGRRAPLYLEGAEPDILRRFWSAVSDAADAGPWYGHALHSFDLPFLIKRSWLHGLAVPLSTVFSDRGFINHRRFVDTMQTFQCGQRADAYASLDTIAKFFGLPARTDVLGAEFAPVYAADRPRALAYLARDLALVEDIATRMFSAPAAAA